MFEQFRPAIKENNVSKEDAPDLSKRKFLKRGAAAVAGLAVGGVALSHVKEKMDGAQSFEQWKKEFEKDAVIFGKEEDFIPYKTIDLADAESSGKFEIDYVGIRHHPNSLYNNFEEIERRVNDSGFVMLEYFNLPGETQNLRFEDVGSVAVDFASKNGTTRDCMMQSLYENKKEHHAAKVYGIIAGIAAKQGKDIVVVNPENKKAEAISGMPSSVMTAIAMLPVVYKLAELKRQEEESGGVDRRTFLKAGMISAVAAAWAYSLANLGEEEFRFVDKKGLESIGELLKNMEEKGITKEIDSEQEKLKKLAWCINDWRDASVALGILKMKESDEKNISENGNVSKRYFQGDKSGLVMQGSAHKNVLAYLRDPEKAKRRMKLYGMTFNLVGDFNIRRYRYSNEKKTFELISQEAYI